MTHPPLPRAPLARPTLIPGLARIWRAPDELQLGLDPARAVRLELPDPRLARVLDLLDGNRPERQVLLHAADLGVAPAETRQLLDLLRQAGLVLPQSALLPAGLPSAERHRLAGEAAAIALGAATGSPARTLRRRRTARVVLAGRGRLAATIAVALAEAGVGHVHPDLSGTVGPADLPGSPLIGTDLGSPLHTAVAAAVRRAVPGTQVCEVRRAPASLVVQLAHDQPVALLAAAHSTRRQPHLAVHIRDGAAVIGPFVPAAGRPCLHCLDLHRRERDPEWPGLPGTGGVGGPGGTEPCAVATVLAAAGFATAEALTFLDGGTPDTLGAAVEISAPGRTRRRTWPPHPECACGARARRSPIHLRPSAATQTGLPKRAECGGSVDP
ncbi:MULTISPECIES: thiamine biosynthesis protein ThiF [unclassified Actinoplanes]|uniref:thiamine biosynthesis protein ThiF n=1 Tax=unclassified Actinoplanes TaxID=2626549 RepID=UPI0006942B61|nr:MULTISPECIES: thiamine biosynthesis protein ThiF [unclassified Actinoplanes]